VWVKDNDCSILKVEWYQESIENYQYIEKVAKVLAAKPRIKLVTEYDYEKNGLRFPGRYYVEEAYMVLEFGKFVRSRKDVKYRDYKFFTVETEVKIKK
jgi:hypothetical protein